MRPSNTKKAKISFIPKSGSIMVDHCADRQIALIVHRCTGPDREEGLVQGVLSCTQKMHG